MVNRTKEARKGKIKKGRYIDNKKMAEEGGGEHKARESNQALGAGEGVRAAPR